MFLWSTLKKTWTKLLRRHSHDARKESLALLCLEYIEERKSSLQLQRHAEQMRYPEFREKLLRIAKSAGAPPSEGRRNSQACLIMGLPGKTGGKTHASRA